MTELKNLQNLFVTKPNHYDVVHRNAMYGIFILPDKKEKNHMNIDMNITTAILVIILLCGIMDFVIDIIDIYRPKVSHVIDKATCIECVRTETVKLSDNGTPVTAWTGHVLFEYNNTQVKSTKETDFMNCEPGKQYTIQIEIIQYIRQNMTTYNFGRIINHQEK